MQLQAGASCYIYANPLQMGEIVCQHLIYNELCEAASLCKKKSI